MPEVDPIPNLPLLRKVLDHIDAHPEEWNQREWFVPTACGTAYCIAGHALAMNGYDVAHVADTEVGPFVDEIARDLLGLTEDEAGDGTWWTDGIFNSRNDRADVQRHAEAIAERAGERL